MAVRAVSQVSLAVKPQKQYATEDFMPTVVLATTNRGKVREFTALIALHPAFASWTLKTPGDLGIDIPPIEETGATFAENALLKARAVAKAVNLPALADDSGLCVDALDGAPGLRSARWAGPNASDAERIALLLARLAAVPEAGRAARFVCALALVRPDGEALTTEAACEGVIAAAPDGADGFGYDPVFLLPALGQTMAQLSPAEKNTLSHRAQAVARLAEALLNFPEQLHSFSTHARLED